MKSDGEQKFLRQIDPKELRVKKIDKGNCKNVMKKEKDEDFI